jgi:hypothetical protein
MGSTNPSSDRVDGFHETVASNNSANGWISQKYGGTSIGKFPVQIAEIVK